MRKTADIKVKTDNVAVGQEFKNYKELCAGLKITDKESINAAGNRRIAVLKEIERYVAYEKDGNKYIITDVYEHPLMKDDKRLQGKYVKSVELILCKYLDMHSPKDAKLSDVVSYYLTPVGWFKIFGLCNAKYKDSRYTQELLKMEGLNKDAIHEFYLYGDNRLKGVLSSALKSLKRQRLIEYRERRIICFDDYTQRPATDEEDNGIFIAERDTLVEMGLKDLYQMRLRKLSEKFYGKVYEKLIEDSEKWKYGEDEDYERKYQGNFLNLWSYYKVIEISYSPAKIKEQLELIVKEDSENKKILDAIKQNNLNAIDTLTARTKSRKEKIIIGTSKSLDEEMERQAILIDKLIKFEEDEIPKSFKEFFATR